MFTPVERVVFSLLAKGRRQKRASMAGSGPKYGKDFGNLLLAQTPLLFLK